MFSIYLMVWLMVQIPIFSMVPSLHPLLGGTSRPGTARGVANQPRVHLPAGRPCGQAMEAALSLAVWWFQWWFNGITLGFCRIGFYGDIVGFPMKHDDFLRFSVDMLVYQRTGNLSTNIWHIIIPICSMTGIFATILPEQNHLNDPTNVKHMGEV